MQEPISLHQQTTKTQRPMTSVFIGDNNQLLLDGIQLILNQQPDIQCVGTARTSASLLEKIVLASPDILLLSTNLSGSSGLKICRLVQEQCPNCAIVGLSMYGEGSVIKSMLNLGAKGYLLKTAGQGAVLNAVRRVADGENYYCTEVMKVLLNNKKTTIRHRAYPISKLSGREKQVLDLIIREYTTTEIGTKLFISPGTVETHRKNLLSKLNARNTAGLVRISMEYNLLQAS